jgi:hypothetical protein
MIHPVWSVYDELRTARLNVKYYGRRLAYFENVNFALELVLLASAPTSAIAGLWFFKTPMGHDVWQYFGIVAGVAAVIKQPLNLTKRIKDYEGVLSGYRMLELELREIKTAIEQKGKFDGPLKSEFKRAQQRLRTIVAKAPEPRERVSLKRQCENEVLAEFPTESFFVPNDGEHHE